ncbi:MAG: preprotein translocase subunit SecG [Candidatus Latescibacterota bacterium]
MGILLTIIHVLVCFLLVLAVLLQSGKGGGLAASIGGGLSSSSVLGGRSAATFLSKATAVLAAVFMLSSVAQALLARAPTQVPTTATERVMQGRGAAPEPVPFQPGEGGGLLPEATEEGAPQPESGASPGQGESEQPAPQPGQGNP